jgi:phytoene dehydrogenase-like protein
VVDVIRSHRRLGQVIAAGAVVVELFSAAGAEPELGDAVAEGQRRHREGARITVDRILDLGGLRDEVDPERAQALIALSTSYEAWRELINSYQLSWDDAEACLTDALSRALLKRATRNTHT